MVQDSITVLTAFSKTAKRVKAVYVSFISPFGPDVQVRVAGRYVTVLLDPHSYDTVIKDSDSLDFNRYAQMLMEKIFNLRLPCHQPVKAKAIMKKYALIMLYSKLKA